MVINDILTADCSSGNKCLKMCPLSEYLKRINSILPDHSVVCVSTLEEGFSNQTYHLSWPGHDGMVLRIPVLDEQAFGVNRVAELEIWHMAADRGLTAQVWWQEVAGGVACEFLAGTTLPWDVSHTDASLMPLCQTLQRLHTLPSVVQEYDVYALMQSWLTQIACYTHRHTINHLYQQVETLFQTLDRPQRPQRLHVCHNDLNPKNMLFDGHQVWLIDWECAGMNDVLFDFAVLVHAHRLTSDQMARAYEQMFDTALTASAALTIGHYREAYVLRELIWLLLCHVRTGSKDLDCVQWYHRLFTDPIFNPYFKQSDYEPCSRLASLTGR